MKFKMIIKRLAQTRKASEDMENTVLLATEESELMALSAYPSDTVFEVDIKEEHE